MIYMLQRHKHTQHTRNRAGLQGDSFMVWLLVRGGPGQRFEGYGQWIARARWMAW